jgi:KDO2-lipid IV(A) lauroyltransferase
MRNRIEFLAVVMLRGLIRMLPRRVSLGFGNVLGQLFYLLDVRRRELAVDNLKAAFPARSDRTCRALIRSTFGNFGRHVVEFLNFDSMSANQMMALVDIEGEEKVDQAIAAGNGVMFYTGHFGYWELLIMVHAFRFSPLVLVARTLDNPFLELLIERIRTRVGTRVIPRQGAIRGLFRALAGHSSVGLMIDQHIQDRSAVKIDFFNRPAATTSAIAALALRTGVSVIPVFALPSPGGRYRLIYEAPVNPPAADDPDPIRTYTQRCTDVLEMYVRRYPDLWLWMHRRWRTEVNENNCAASEKQQEVFSVRKDLSS